MATASNIQDTATLGTTVNAARCLTLARKAKHIVVYMQLNADTGMYVEIKKWDFINNAAAQMGAQFGGYFEVQVNGDTLYIN